MQTRLKGSPLCLVLTFLLTVNIVWTLNNMQRPGDFGMAFWKLCLFSKVNCYVRGTHCSGNTLFHLRHKKKKKGICTNWQKTVSCCKSSWVRKCWTYHYVWTVFAQVSSLWWGPFVILNSSLLVKCCIGCPETQRQRGPMVALSAIKLEQ